MTTQEIITTRKSVRAYTSEQLTKAELSTILNAAYAAPVAGGAYQKMRLTVVQDAAILKRISDTYRKEGVKADMLFGAPTLILVSGDKSFDDTALFANVGCIIENIQLSAWDMGLGSVFNWAAGTVLPEEAGLLAELGIGEAFKPLAGVVIGHPAKDVPARVKKVSMETNYIR